VQTENEKAVRDPMRNELEKLLHDYLDFNIETDGLAQRTREAIAALQSQVLNTDGWVMVPVEPTGPMLEAGIEEMIRIDAPEPIYKAMLSAAQKAKP
jgi:hypothetical protein